FGLDAGYVILGERPSHAIDCIDPCRTYGDYFRDQRVVVRRHGVAGINMRVDSNATAAGRVIKSYPAWRRLKIFLWIFGVDAALDGMQARSCMRDVRGKRFSGSNANLFFDQVTSINLFRDRVFHLDARIHLDEIKMPILIDEELDRARIFVSDRLGQLHGCIAHFLAKPRRHQRRWTFLDHFLVTPLNGTIAFAEMNDVSMTIGDNLKFDVMRIDDELLDVNL